jgi:hypothetical protein
MLDKGRATPQNRGAEAAARYRAGSAGDSGGLTGERPRQRAGHVLQIEDLLLAGWVFAVEEFVRQMAGDPFRLVEDMTTGHGGSGWMAVLASLTPTGWLLVALFLFVLLTRGPEDTDRDVALGRRWPMLGPALPLLSIYALVATGIQALAGWLPEREPGEEPPWPGPYVPHVVRRTAAVPLAFIGDALFRSEIANTSVGVLSGPLEPGTPTLPTLLVALLSALPFMLFVAGPRIAAGAQLAWRPWIVRFAVFYLASWLGSYVFVT